MNREEPEFSAELWVRKHWGTAPMLTRGMMEVAWAIMNGYTEDVWPHNHY
jgi:hypothetical protein